MKLRHLYNVTLIVITCGLTSSPIVAEASKKATKDDHEKVEATGGYVVGSKTNIDFSEANIEGQFRAPAGFFLQGKQGQSMSQMVKLRSNFRSELRSSKSGVKAIIK